MKKKFIVLYILILLSCISHSQGVGIGTADPDPSSVLDITHPAKGMLIPRMTTAAVHTIPDPARGLLVYDSLTNQLMVNTGTPFIPNWQPVASNNNVWNLTGNSGINPVNKFIGTTDNQPLNFKVNNIQVGELNPGTKNIFWGLHAGQANTTGLDNIAIGTGALKLNTIFPNVVAIGDSALFHNNSLGNTAIGSKALFSNTTGGRNTAIGFNTLISNTTGTVNTAIGSESLSLNTTGSENTASGFFSLSGNTTGGSNTASGFLSLFSNTTGSSNTAAGSGSLLNNTTGFNNTAFGTSSLSFNSVGSNNTAVGRNALSRTTGSQFNTVIGSGAASFFDMGFNNTIIGANADVNQPGLFNCVALGQGTICTASSQVRLGNTFTNSIGGFVGFSNLSDGRYKKNIAQTVKGIDFIMKLHPVMYQLDMEELHKKLYPGKELDELSKRGMEENGKTIFSGFVAQEVEQAAKDAGYDFSGIEKPKNENDMYGLRYAEFVVPLVKAMQEQQLIIQKQQKLMEELNKQIADLQNRVLSLEKSRP